MNFRINPLQKCPKTYEFGKVSILNLEGEANKILVDINPSKTFALKPDDFFSTTPKLLVKEGEKVQKGTPLFFAKENPRIHFVSPVSGEVTAIVRGAKRRILEVVITDDGTNNAIRHNISELSDLSSEQTKEILLKSGAWPFFTQRPYGTIAQPEDSPKAIFVSTYTTAPLDVDYDFLLKNNKKNFKKALMYWLN